MFQTKKGAKKDSMKLGESEAGQSVTGSGILKGACALLRVVVPEGLGQRGSLSLERCVNPKAQEQWAGLAEAKISFLQGKSQA